MSSTSTEPVKKPLLSDLSYTTLKHVAAVVLPAAGALYYALASLWHLPNAENVVGTIAAVNVFLGVLMTISTASYNKSDAKYVGDLEVGLEDDGKTSIRVAMNSDEAVDSVLTQKDAVLKVVPKPL